MDSHSSAGGGGGGDEFPVGLRVLVVDDDRTCLKIVDRMLKACRYIVTTCSRAVEALDTLRERKGGFDVVLSDVYMPDMDGFKLLELVGLEMDLPVIMMSADDGKDVVMKGVTHGACDYLIKPVRMEALKNIWQHVIRKKRNGLKELEYSGSMEESDKQKKPSNDGDNASSVNESGWTSVKRKKDGEEEDESEEREDTSSLKKQRVVWSVELHKQFVAAVNQLGFDNAVPKKILELMNNPLLSRENVASHLQKYRNFLKRITVPQHQGRADTSFSNVPESSPFRSTNSLDGYALAASGQIPHQALMTIHPGPRSPTNICMNMSTADQIRFFNSNAQLANSSKIRPASVHQANNTQMSLFYGPSASMDRRQIGQAQQNFQYNGNMGIQVDEGTQGFSSLPSSLRTSSSFSSDMMNGHTNNSLVMQMNQQGQQISPAQQQVHIQIGIPRQSQQRGHLFNASEHSFMVSSTAGRQQMVSNDILVRTGPTMNGVASPQENMNVSPYGSVPQALYPNIQQSSMGGSSYYPQVTNSGAANHTTAGMIQEAISTAPGGLEALDNLKGENDVIPSYDTFSDRHQNKNQDGKFQNMNLSYESTQNLGSKQSNIDYGSSVTTHQDFNGTFEDGAVRDTCTIRTERLSIIQGIEHDKMECVSQDELFAEESSSNELMSVFGKQQDSFGRMGHGFNFE